MGRDFVLIAEDDAAAVRVVTRMLPADLIRRIASTVAMAINMLREHSDWALILIDVGLGAGDSGLRVLDVAVAEHPHVARALVTGDDSAEVNNYARACSTDVIRKPFDRAALAPTLARVPAGLSSLNDLGSQLTTLAERVRLTTREQQILARLVAGEKRESMLATMGIKKRTVDAHVSERERAFCGLIEHVI